MNCQKHVHVPTTAVGRPTIAMTQSVGLLVPKAGVPALGDGGNNTQHVLKGLLIGRVLMLGNRDGIAMIVITRVSTCYLYIYLYISIYIYIYIYIFIYIYIYIDDAYTIK